MLGCHLPSNDMISSIWEALFSKRHVGLSCPFKWHIKFKIRLSSPFSWHVEFKLACLPFKETRLDRYIPSNDMLSSSWVISFSKRKVGLSLVQSGILSSSWVVRLTKRHVGQSTLFKWHVQVRSSAFNIDMLGCYLPSNDTLSSRLVFHLRSSDMLSSSWVVRLSKRHVGFLSPFKWHVMFKLVRLPFKETCWVFISLQMTH